MTFSTFIENASDLASSFGITAAEVTSTGWNAFHNFATQNSVASTITQHLNDNLGSYTVLAALLSLLSASAKCYSTQKPIFANKDWQPSVIKMAVAKSVANFGIAVAPYLVSLVTEDPVVKALTTAFCLTYTFVDYGKALKNYPRVADKTPMAKAVNWVHQKLDHNKPTI